MVCPEGECAVPHWERPWTARAGAGRTFSGTWQADLAGFTGKTFEDMLKRVPGAADALRGTGGFKDQNGKDCAFGLALCKRRFLSRPLEAPQKLDYLLFSPAAVVAIGIGQE